MFPSLSSRGKTMAEEGQRNSLSHVYGRPSVRPSVCLTMSALLSDWLFVVVYAVLCVGGRRERGGGRGGRRGLKCKQRRLISVTGSFACLSLSPSVYLSVFLFCVSAC